LLPARCQLLHGAEKSLKLEGGVIGGEDDEKGKWVVVATGGWGVIEYPRLD
jgi:hypothetical protein